MVLLCAARRSACAPGRRTRAASRHEPTTRRAYDLDLRRVRPRRERPAVVVADRAQVDDAGSPPSRAVSSRRDDVVGVTAPVVSPDGAVAVLDAQPAFGPADERTPALRRGGPRRACPTARCSPATPRCSPTSPRLLADRLLARHRLRRRRLGAAAGDGVPLGRGPAQGGGDEPAVDRRGVRRPHRGLPVGLGRGAARPRPRGPGLELGADPDLRDPVRPLDGLRGLPALPGPGGLAGHRRRARQRRARALRRPAGSSPRPPRSWSPSSSASPPRSTSWSRCSASAWRSRSSWTRPSSGWSSCRRRCRCSAGGTGGCRPGSTGCSRPSPSRRRTTSPWPSRVPDRPLVGV